MEFLLDTYGALSVWFGLVFSVTSPKSGDGRC